jgi:hypothetical protein
VRNGEDPGGKGFGPGLVFEVDPRASEAVYQELGEDAERIHQGTGFTSPAGAMSCTT